MLALSRDVETMRPKRVNTAFCEQRCIPALSFQVSSDYRPSVIAAISARAIHLLLMSRGSHLASVNRVLSDLILPHGSSWLSCANQSIKIKPEFQAQVPVVEEKAQPRPQPAVAAFPSDPRPRSGL